MPQPAFRQPNHERSNPLAIHPVDRNGDAARMAMTALPNAGAA